MKMCPMKNSLCTYNTCGWWIQDKGCALAILADGTTDLPSCLNNIECAINELGSKLIQGMRDLEVVS